MSSAIKGRGATSNLPGRFETVVRGSVDDDSAEPLVDEAPRPLTQLHVEQARTILSRNDSPDLRFSQTLNPYRGCEHGCIYCYARPTHAYVNLSPGLDFETQLFAKRNAAELLRKELSRPGYRVTPIQLGAATDPYQPIERRERITRAVLEVLLAARHPVTIVTKSALITRDLDLLQALAEQRLVQVFLSITQLDNGLTRVLEPRASSPERRLEALAALARAGVPVSVLVAPIIPFLNDAFLERVLERAKQAGALGAGYTTIRLPWEVRPLFTAWLAHHFPDRAQHVLTRIRDLHGGRDNTSEFGSRMRGQGPWSELIRQRFRVACKRLGLLTGEALAARVALDSTRFDPGRLAGQARLF
ncbi:MAG: PA0069 family radical SAM protein [Casimicrobiaceae bacterium]|nr:PA0069 family radical SAM protein [Casimicrobiaceae bacterium]